MESYSEFHHPLGQVNPSETKTWSDHHTELKKGKNSNAAVYTSGKSSRTKLKPVKFIRDSRRADRMTHRRDRRASTKFWLWLPDDSYLLTV